MSVFHHASWIFAADQAPAIDSYYDYAQTFSVSGKEAVTLYLSAHTNYAVYINGQFVDCGQLPDFDTRQIYDTLDITGFVRQGENLLKVTQYVAGAPFMTSTVQTPGLIFALWEGKEQRAVSSTETPSGRNRKYRSNAEKITHQLGFTFDYNANSPETLFAPSIVAEKSGRLIPRPVKKLTVGQPQEGALLAQGVFLENDSSLPNSKRMHTAYLSAVPKKQLLTENGWALPEDRRADGAYFVYDLGGETIGYPQLQLSVERETEILIGFGEHLEDLRVRSSCGYRNFCFRYVAQPGENLFFHPFRRLGLRYMQLHVYGSKGTIRQVAIRPTRYPMARKPIPVTDGLHKRIWEVASKTLELCMQDYFCDCIWREQSMYAYDGRMELLACYHGFDAPEYARESLRICAERKRSDRLLEMCAPGTEPSNAPHYSAMYLRDILEYCRYTGDLTLAEEVFPVLENIAQGFAEKITKKNLVPLYPGQEYWAFYEWQPGMDGKYWGTTTREVITEEDYDLPLNFFVADGFRCYAAVCQLLGKDGSAYLSLCEKICQALHQTFWCPEQGGYATRLNSEPRHETVQGMMLYLDAVPEYCKSAVETLVRSKKLLRPTLGLSVYVYEGMLKNPANRDFVIEDLETRWGMMLNRGCDTFWETERGTSDFNGAGALCQGWSSIPLYLFGHYNLE